MEYKNDGADAKTQKKTHDEGVVKHEKREREKEYDGLTLKEMRRKHGIGENIGGEEILAAYKEDKINSVKREETAEEIAKQRKILEQAKMELEWDRKEREARRDLEGEESEHKMSRPEETLSRRANPLTSQFTPSYGMVLNLLQRYDLEKSRELVQRCFGCYLAPWPGQN